MLKREKSTNFCPRLYFNFPHIVSLSVRAIVTKFGYQNRQDEIAIKN